MLVILLILFTIKLCARINIFCSKRVLQKGQDIRGRFLVQINFHRKVNQEVEPSRTRMGD